jgi:hypothetical protein
MNWTSRPLPNIGDRFGLLTIIDIGKYDHQQWLVCACKCGNKKEVRKHSLISGATQSCGCTRRRNVWKKHGKHGTPTYRSWCSMKARCKNIHRDGAHSYVLKGIRVCDRWMLFENFLSDMGEAPLGKTIDRIDPDGNYEPSNCRWATSKEQGNNRTNNHVLIMNGESLTVTQWSEKLGIRVDTILLRLTRGWPVEKALRTSVRYISPKGFGSRSRIKKNSPQSSYNNG